MRVLVVCALLAIGLAACADRRHGDTAALEDQMFLSTALAHAQSEYELAQLATTKAHTPSVVAYAKRVSGERAPLSDQLAAMAHAAGLSADTEHTPDPARFADLSGEAFERAYIASQIEDQQNAIEDFSFAAKRPHDPALEKIAADALPQLKADYADAIEVVYDIPFETEAEGAPEPDMGAGAVGKRH